VTVHVLMRHLDIADSVRGVMLILAAQRRAGVVLNKIAEGLTRRDSWVERVEVYDAYPSRRTTASRRC